MIDRQPSTEREANDISIDLNAPKRHDAEQGGVATAERAEPVSSIAAGARAECDALTPWEAEAGGTWAFDPQEQDTADTWAAWTEAGRRAWGEAQDASAKDVPSPADRAAPPPSSNELPASPRTEATVSVADLAHRIPVADMVAAHVGAELSPLQPPEVRGRASADRAEQSAAASSAAEDRQTSALNDLMVSSEELKGDQAGWAALAVKLGDEAETTEAADAHPDAPSEPQVTADETPITAAAEAALDTEAEAPAIEMAAAHDVPDDEPIVAIKSDSAPEVTTMKALPAGDIANLAADEVPTPSMATPPKDEEAPPVALDGDLASGRLAVADWSADDVATQEVPASTTETQAHSEEEPLVALESEFASDGLAAAEWSADDVAMTEVPTAAMSATVEPEDEPLDVLPFIESESALNERTESPLIEEDAALDLFVPDEANQEQPEVAATAPRVEVTAAQEPIESVAALSRAEESADVAEAAFLEPDDEIEQAAEQVAADDAVRPVIDAAPEVASEIEAERTDISDAASMPTDEPDATAETSAPLSDAADPALKYPWMRRLRKVSGAAARIPAAAAVVPVEEEKPAEPFVAYAATEPDDDVDGYDVESSVYAPDSDENEFEGEPLVYAADGEPIRKSSGAMWTIPLLCAGICIIACCLLIPQTDANRRLAYERDRLRLDLESIRQQMATNEEFLRRIHDDPTLAERLAQRQMKTIRAGTQELPLGPAGSVATEGGMSPFQLVAVQPPPAAPPYTPKGGFIANLCYNPRSRLYLTGLGLTLMAAGLVLGESTRRT